MDPVSSFLNTHQANSDSENEILELSNEEDKLSYELIHKLAVLSEKEN